MIIPKHITNCGQIGVTLKQGIPQVFQLAVIGLADETKVHKCIDQIRKKVATETKVEQKESCRYVSESLTEYE